MSVADKLTAITENEQRVYDAGKTTQEQAFWDIYQSKGSRENYLCAFAGTGWTNNNFLPHYDIVPISSAYMMFRSSLITGDLADMLSGLGVALDFSQSTDVRFAFMGTDITRLGVIDLSSATMTESAFSGATSLHTIDTLRLKEDGSQTFANFFSKAYALENITMEGTIGNNISFSPCTKLTHDSLMNIINALQAKESGSFVLTLGTDNLAKLTDEEKAIATEKGWTLA